MAILKVHQAVVVAAVSLLVAGGCGRAPSGPPDPTALESSGGLNGLANVGRPVLLDAMVPAPDGAAIERLQLHETARCMEERGFGVRLPNSAGLEVAAAASHLIERLAFGMGRDALLPDGTIGITSVLLPSQDIDSVVRSDADYGTAWDDELRGNSVETTNPVSWSRDDGLTFQIDGNSCSWAAQEALFGSVSGVFAFSNTPLRLQDEVDTRIRALPEVALALDEFEGCMSRDGYSYRDPLSVWAAVLDVSGDDFNRAASLERELSPVVASCSDDSGLLDVVLSSQGAIEDQVLLEHAGEYEQFAAILDAALSHLDS